MVIYIEKKQNYRNEENVIKNNILTMLGIELEELRIIEVYDSNEEILSEDIENIFSNRMVDDVYLKLPELEGYSLFRMQSLPTQFDQRRYWAQKLLDAKERNIFVNYSRVFAFKNLNDDKKLNKIKNYLINPLESFERKIDDFSYVQTTRNEDLSYTKVEEIESDLNKVIEKYNLSMEIADLEVIRDYFKSIGKIPNYTELRMLDTYWSDHCRHTTFSKIYKDVDFSEYNIERAKKELEFFKKESKNKDVTLMNLALFPMKYQKRNNNLQDLDVSEEINAATIIRKLEDKDIMVLFKNETHNHPTEIEPFGGASTCIGGAIRDPLSGRAYVYQGMRITGAKKTESDTLVGKLPQYQICRKSAHGYSSYGNQIGLNTGYVNEYYHDGFEAKRMELGFVIGSVKKENVIRKTPEKGDLLVLLGGKTGLDGIGGASGSSKTHKKDTTDVASAEVQKGNAPEERKLQRLFKYPEVSRVIKRCNDLGAGGISVAFGEIARGLEIDLSKVHLKYTDIFPFEIFLSESQERMAIVINKDDLELVQKYAELENVEYSIIGSVTDNNRLIVKHDGNVLVDISRDLLDMSGSKYYVEAKATRVDLDKGYEIHPKVENNENLMRMFDSSIGARNVLNPYGGKTKLTRTDGMVSLIPYTERTVSIVTHDYDPNLSEWSPYHGGYYAVVNSVLKNVAFGSKVSDIRLTFQEYFETLKDKESFGKPLLSILGANTALNAFSLASIGGKDSMSGTYTAGEIKINVPPTLVSFAVNTADVSDIITHEFKSEDSNIVIYAVKKDEEKLLDLELLKEKISYFESDKENILSAEAFDSNIEEVLLNMSLGNTIGYNVVKNLSDYVGIVAEVSKLSEVKGEVVGETSAVEFSEEEYRNTLINTKDSKIYTPVSKNIEFEYDLFDAKELRELTKKDKVKVFIPIFEGTNCEFDVTNVFEVEGAEVTQFVFTNDVKESLEKLSKGINETDILALVGGFSAADEPDGSAKFISNIFRTEKVKNSFENLIKRDGLVIGICNGFQALVKLGVFNDDKIEEVSNIDYTLTYNKNMNHIADYVDTKIISNASYFLSNVEVGKIYKTPISHGEGRFVVGEETFNKFKKKGQIFSVYKNTPNGSFYDIEGLVSPSGQILGKMGHNERVRSNTAINIYDKNDLLLFKSAVDSKRRKY